MDAIEIIDAMRQKAQQLDNPRYTVTYIDKLLPPSAVITIEGATDYFYILGNPSSIRIESEDALYDSGLTGTGNRDIDRMHQHQGNLKITNLSGANHTQIQLRQQTFAPLQCENKGEQEINIEVNQKTLIINK